MSGPECFDDEMPIRWYSNPERGSSVKTKWGDADPYQYTDDGRMDNATSYYDYSVTEGGGRFDNDDHGITDMDREEFIRVGSYKGSDNPVELEKAGIHSYWFRGKAFWKCNRYNAAVKKLNNMRKLRDPDPDALNNQIEIVKRLAGQCKEAKRKYAEKVNENKIRKRKQMIARTEELEARNVARGRDSEFIDGQFHGSMPYENIQIKAEGHLTDTDPLRDENMHENFHTRSLKQSVQSIDSERSSAINYFRDMTGLDFSNAKKEKNALILPDATVKPFFLNRKLNNQVKSASRMGDSKNSSLKYADSPVYDGGYQLTITNPKGFTPKSGKLVGNTLPKSTSLLHGILHVKHDDKEEIGSVLRYKSIGPSASTTSIDKSTVETNIPLEVYQNSSNGTHKRLGTGSSNIIETNKEKNLKHYAVNTMLFKD